jgi:Dyp-type peroxidase family
MIEEPVLDLKDIQGIAVPGFFKPHQALLFLQFDDSPTVQVEVVRHLLELLSDSSSPRITNALQALEDRRNHRQKRKAIAKPLLALALTRSGLNRLSDDLASTVPSVAFQSDMAARAGLLGDPDPRGWAVGSSAAGIDVVLVIAGDSKRSVADLASALETKLVGDRSYLRAAPTQFGNVRRRKARGHEHFGFADGISQPGIRGRSVDSHCADAFITPRALPASDPEHDLFGQPGQDLVWPGEFVLGYPASSPDPRIPGPARPAPDWMRNGSFLVFRRLQQHVATFKSAMASEAARLRKLPGFRNMSDKRLAALLVGRWPSGAPVVRSPVQDCPAMAVEPLLNNDFRYDDDTPKRTCLPERLAMHPVAKADPIGLVCPMAAHVRKVNLRDQASDAGGASGTQSRRLLRVGIPYGDDPPRGGNEGESGDCGLLFLSIQASIEDQFEFLQARWMNSATRPRGLGGHDMLLGQPADGIRRCTVFGEGMQQEDVIFKDAFVTMTGGAYLFVPGLKTLRELLVQAVQAHAKR